MGGCCEICKLIREAIVYGFGGCQGLGITNYDSRLRVLREYKKKNHVLK